MNLDPLGSRFHYFYHIPYPFRYLIFLFIKYELYITLVFSVFRSLWYQFNKSSAAQVILINSDT